MCAVLSVLGRREGEPGAFVHQSDALWPAMPLGGGRHAGFASAMTGRERQGDEGGVLVIQGVLGLGLCLGLLVQGGLLQVGGFGARIGQESPWGVSCLRVLWGRWACSAERAVSALGRPRVSEDH